MTKMLREKFIKISVVSTKKMSIIDTDISVHLYTTLTFHQCPRRGRLSQGEHCLDEDAHGAPRWVPAPDDAEAQRPVAGALLEHDGADLEGHFSVGARQRAVAQLLSRL